MVNSGREERLVGENAQPFKAMIINVKWLWIMVYVLVEQFELGCLLQLRWLWWINKNVSFIMLDSRLIFNDSGMNFFVKGGSFGCIRSDIIKKTKTWRPYKSEILVLIEIKNRPDVNVHKTPGKTLTILSCLHENVNIKFEEKEMFTWCYCIPQLINVVWFLFALGKSKKLRLNNLNGLLKPINYMYMQVRACAQ